MEGGYQPIERIQIALVSGEDLLDNLGSELVQRVGEGSELHHTIVSISPPRESTSIRTHTVRHRCAEPRDRLRSKLATHG